jgi:predicted HTH domain antitoxin
MAAAMKLFELGQLSSGAAAGLAGVPRVVFLSRFADYGVDTFSVTAEDLRKETRLA